MQFIQQFGFPILLLVVFYFLLIAPQRKKEKRIKEMRENLRVGDEIITIGGVVGKITAIKEDVLTVEVGADKTKLKFMRWGVASVTNQQEAE